MEDTPTTAAAPTTPTTPTTPAAVEPPADTERAAEAPATPPDQHDAEAPAQATDLNAKPEDHPNSMVQPPPDAPQLSLAERVIVALRSEWHKLTEEEQEMVAAVKSWMASL